MKKNNRKKRLPGYWLGTRKPTSLGYQPNYGIGNAQFTTVEGEDLTPEVKAARRNILPSTLNKATQAGMNISNILQNTTPAMSSAALNAAVSSSIKAAPQAVQNLQVMKNLGNLAEKGALKSAEKGVLNAAGTTLAALGTAYGAYDIYNQFANAGDHRSVSDMRNTLATNTYTTDYGNQYTEYTGLNRQAELDYEKAQRLQKRLNLGVSSIGTGASAGALVGSTILPGLGTGLGTALGAGLGAAFSGIASLFGFGDNEDEIEQQMKDLADTTSRQNRQSRSIAENQDTKDAFYGRAANGKQPVWSPAGLVNKKATARVSNGELIGNFEDGYVSRVPGKKNNKDTKLANLKDSDFVISNKYGLSDYAAATGDYEGALNMQDMLMNYKNGKKPCCACGKLPKKALGQLGEYALATLPHLGSYFSNLAQYNRAKHANKYVPQFEIQNPESSAAINQVMSDMIDPREYLNQSNNAYRQAAWNLQRNPAMGLGGRMVMLDALNRAKFAQDAQTRMKIDEANRAQRNVGAQMRDQMGRDLLAKRYDNMWRRHRAAQEANAAQENWLAQYRKNMDTALVSGAADALRMLQYNKANDIQNKMLGIYQQNADVEKLRALKEVYGTVPADSTTPTATAPASTTSTTNTDAAGSRLFNPYVMSIPTFPHSTYGIKARQYTPSLNSDWWKDYEGAMTQRSFNPYFGLRYLSSNASPISTSSSIAVDDRLRGPGRYGYEQPGWSLADRNYMLSLVR